MTVRRSAAAGRGTGARPRTGFGGPDDAGRATTTAYTDNPRAGVHDAGTLTWGTAP